LKTAVKRLYEGMFLVDTALAASDWDGVMGAIKGIFDKIEAEVVSLEKWDERRLAYPIQGKTRGTYLLAYFNVGSDKIATIEREVQLSETLMRVLILRTDAMSPEDLKRETPVQIAEREAAERGVAAAEREAREQAAAAEPVPAPEESEDEKSDDSSQNQ